jgi:uncharacterized protein involved in exopolysaccharide biosynthesis
MSKIQNIDSNSEINLKELFLILWAYKLFIIFLTIVGIFFGTYKALNTDKHYTSTAIFKPHQDKLRPQSFDGVAALIGMAGLGTTSSSTISIERQKRRNFIEYLDKKLNFKNDKFFNNYDPNNTEPPWKKTIKKLIGLETVISDPEEIIWQGIINVYQKYVEIKSELDGSIKIIVTHEDATKASEIANFIMHTMIGQQQLKNDTDQDDQLNYLSKTLANALADLESAQSELKTFALENSALPLETFAAGSIKLNSLREQYSRTVEIYEAVSQLNLIMDNKKLTDNDYFLLRDGYPIVDQVEFRRVLGLNEIISNWDWPNKKSVEAILKTLFERKKSLQSRINTSQLNAERSSEVLELYGKLRRKEKISEATYTILIEQVKAASLVSGFRPDNALVYEYAAPSISPSAPNRSLMMMIGAILGAFGGCTFSLLIGRSRGVFYSKESLITASEAFYNVSIRSLMPLRKKSFSFIKNKLVNNPQAILRDLALEINKNKSKYIAFTSLNTKMKAIDVARALSVYMKSDYTKIAIINFSQNNKKTTLTTGFRAIGSFNVDEDEENISILYVNNSAPPLDLFSMGNFEENWKSIDKNFEYIFMCADNDEAITLVRAIRDLNVYHILLAKTKLTKSSMLSKICTIIPIQGLLHD